jgi:hypothetical protein
MQMKRRKEDHAGAPAEIEAADCFDAKEAVRFGHERPIGWYLRDAAEILSLLANLLDPMDQNEQRLQFTSGSTSPATPIPDEAVEWEGSHSQVKEAIRAGSAEPIGWYLRDVVDLLRRVAAALDARKDSRQWQLKFVRKGRGRRSDETQKMLADSRIAFQLRMMTHRAGKQESAIAELKDSRGISRATLFRAKGPSKGIRESHKKR